MIKSDITKSKITKQGVLQHKTTSLTMFNFVYMFITVYMGTIRQTHMRTLSFTDETTAQPLFRKHFIFFLLTLTNCLLMKIILRKHGKLRTLRHSYVVYIIKKKNRHLTKRTC